MGTPPDMGIRADRLLPAATALGNLNAAGERGRRGRRVAKSTLSWDAIAEQTESVYGSLNQQETGMSIKAGRSSKSELGERSTATVMGEDAIRSRAYEIFLERTATGAPGDATSDWFRAEQETSSRGTGDTAAPRPRVSVRSAAAGRQASHYARP